MSPQATTEITGVMTIREIMRKKGREALSLIEDICHAGKSGCLNTDLFLEIILSKSEEAEELPTLLQALSEMPDCPA